jgi:hypothetical protein
MDNAAEPPSPDSDVVLSPGQRVALRNLATKQAGEAVDWINIADARALTELGFADRGREGWRITPAGSAILLAMGDQDDPEAATEAQTTLLRPDQPFKET